MEVRRPIPSPELEKCQQKDKKRVSTAGHESEDKEPPTLQTILRNDGKPGTAQKCVKEEGFCGIGRAHIS